MHQNPIPCLALKNVGKRFDLHRPRFPVIGSSGIGGQLEHDEQDETYSDADEANGRLTHWALKDISFSVGAGERVAIIGRNGSGKSTLLKIVGGLCLPTEGIVWGRGCVVPLNSILEPFQPRASGLSNIRILCRILRINAEQLQQQLHKIISFSELGERVHDRVSSYSSAMYARLATAAALHLAPDILLIDDSFAVGDHSFREKVDMEIRSSVENGAILLYAGHKIPVLQRQCDRAIWLEGGRVHADGPAEKVLARYENRITAEMETEPELGAEIETEAEAEMETEAATEIETEAGTVTDAGAKTDTDAGQEMQRDTPAIGITQIRASAAFEAWTDPPVRSIGPKLIRPGEGCYGNLVSFVVQSEDGQQPFSFHHPATILCIAIIETLEAEVTFDAQLDLWAGKAHALLARPATPFRTVGAGRHRIIASLPTDILPDLLYTAQMRIAFLDASETAKELALSRCDFFITGKATKDDRRRRFESLWPPKRLRDAFLTPDLEWHESPVWDE